MARSRGPGSREEATPGQGAKKNPQPPQLNKPPTQTLTLFFVTPEKRSEIYTKQLNGARAPLYSFVPEFL